MVRLGVSRGQREKVKRWKKTEEAVIWGDCTLSL